MSAAPAYALRVERGGLAALPDLPPARMTPAEIPLTLSADVLRLPLGPATRLVLAEIVSLYAATSHCDASDNHFAARLTISTDTASRAVKELEAAGLVVKVVTRVAIGQYRTLTPLPEAIAAKAATNPYPQNAGCAPQNAGRPTRKMPETYPQNAATPTRILRADLPAKCGSNTPSNIPVNFHLNPTDAAGAAGGESEKKIEVAAPSKKPQRLASHTEGGAADVATSVPGLAPAPGRLLMRDSPLADFAAFAQAFAQAARTYPDAYAAFAQADLVHYHAALLGWSDANAEQRPNWLAVVTNSMRRDHAAGKLVKTARLAGVAASSPVLQRLATAEAAFALNQYDDFGNRIN